MKFGDGAQSGRIIRRRHGRAAAFDLDKDELQCIAAFGPGGVVTLDSPATPERVYWAVERARATREIAIPAIL